jgi:hypothetical protein
MSKINKCVLLPNVMATTATMNTPAIGKYYHRTSA